MGQIYPTVDDVDYKFHELIRQAFAESDEIRDRIYALANERYALIPDSANKRAVGKNELVLNIKDFGTSFSAVGSGGDDTAAFQKALDAAAPTGGTILCPCGSYKAENLSIPAFVIIKGNGQNSRYAGNTVNGGGKAATRIVRPGAYPSTSTLPMVTVAGAGAGLDNIQLEGSQAPGTILVMQGFESVLTWVRVIGGTGIGIDVQKANNVKWLGIYVDNCGSETLPAMKVWSKAETGNANETNNLDILSLRIERSRNQALVVGVGGTTAEEYVEWFKVQFLHVENSYLDYPNIDALVEFGNVRTAELIAPMLYGGPGPIIKHNQLYAPGAKTYGLGGIIIHGGTLLGSDVGLTKNSRGEAITPLPTKNLIDLVAGDRFKLMGTRLLRCSENAFKVDPAYGRYYYDDAVDLSTLSAWASTARITGKPTLSGVSGILSPTLLGTSSDKIGRVFFGTGPTPAAGVLVQINLYHGDDRDFEVFPVAKTGITAALDLYTAVAADKKSFTIRANNVPAANKTATEYQVAYFVKYFD